MLICSIICIILFIVPLCGFLYYQIFTDTKYNNTLAVIRNHFVCFTISMLILSIFFFLSMILSITYKEIRNYYIKKVSYQEKYSQKVVYFVTVYAGRDSKGNPKFRTESRVRTDYFGPYFIAHSNSGIEYHISQEEYNKWKNLWGEKYIKTIKGSSTLFVKPIDGNYYEAYYNGKFEDTFPKPEVHLYKNVLRNSNSVFGFKYGNGIVHPVDNGNMNGVISEIPLADSEVSEFAIFNAIEGSKRQIHIITLITKNKANNALETITKWGGLNKNELAVFIGIDNDKNIIWTDAHSWMDNTKCQNMIRDQIMLLKKFDAKSIRQIYGDNLKYWKRKEFKDFDYIEVPLPNTCKVIISFMVIVFFAYLFFLAVYINRNKENLIIFR